MIYANAFFILNFKMFWVALAPMKALDYLADWHKLEHDAKLNLSGTPPLHRGCNAASQTPERASFLGGFLCAKIDFFLQFVYYIKQNSCHSVGGITMKVVRFHARDLDAAFAIQRAAFQPLYETYHDDMSPYLESKSVLLQKYLSPGTYGYLFVESGVPVGAVRVRIDPEHKTAKISALAVHPLHQGCGIAQAALRQIEHIHDDVTTWHLSTILQEKRNCHLYEKLGYRQTGAFEQINDTMTLVFYEKRK